MNIALGWLPAVMLYGLYVAFVVWIDRQFWKHGAKK